MPLRLIDALNRKGKSASIRLVQWTGKSPHPVHPKHLIADPIHDWYVEFLAPQDVVLDIGCSNGYHTARAAVTCRQVAGLDRDRTQVGRARSLMEARGLHNVLLIEGEAEGALPFPSALFHKVLLLDVLEHLERRQLLLAEIYRVLRAEGQLILSVPNRRTRWKERLRRSGLFAFGDRDHKIEYTPLELGEELHQGGFRAVGEFLPVVYDFPLAGLLDVIGGISLPLYRRLVHWKQAYACSHPEESTGFRVVAEKLPGAPRQMPREMPIMPGDGREARG